MKRISASYLFVLLFLIVNLRGSLGYIFRFGDPASSPTYSAAPLEYFLFWDVIIGLMTILVISKIKKLSLYYTTIYLLILLFSFICLFQTESFYVHGAIRSMILYGFFFLIIISNEDWIKISQLNKAIEVMTVFGIFFLFYQLYQYHFFGVLPAHSHEHQLIRYGSFYNDSLILGILLPMFAGYFFNKYRNPIPSLLTAIIVCAVVILTGSMTAMAIIFLYVVWSLRKRYLLLSVFLCFALFLSLCFASQINQLWSFKSGSVAEHFEGLNYFKGVGLLTLIGLHPLDKFVEIGYLSFLYNFGMPILIIVLALHFKTLSACRIILSERTSSREMQAFAGAAQGLTISVLLANFNSPPIVYPPVYLVVVIFSAIAIKKSYYVRSLCE